MLKRCSWPGDDALMIEYHDTEWGVPVHDDKKLFEFLLLEGAQAGLAWRTVLNKRENYRKAFDGFDPVRIARYGDKDMERLLSDAGIIRNRLKVESAVKNAKAFLKVRQEFGTFDAYVWQFAGKGKLSLKIPATTKESDIMSEDLLKRGFKFVGSTICYAFMQAVGMTNDHEVECYRYGKVSQEQHLNTPIKSKRA